MKIRELKIFLSSSFKDMHAERDYLLTQIFPRIDLLLRRNGIRLNVVDLRGSEQESHDESFERNVFSMCLNEVDKCTPRMVGIIGTRYGWAPFEIGKSDMMMTHTAQKMAMEHGLTLQEISGKSITHLEIMYGLRVMDTDKCFFFFRHLECSSPLSEKTKEIYFDSQNKNKLNVLIEDLKRAYGTSLIAPEHESGHHLQSYHAIYENGHIIGLEQFGELVYNNLLANLSKELNLYAFKRKDIPTWFIRLINYWDDKCLGTIPFSEVNEISNNKARITCIAGQSGTGKSVLLSQLYFTLQDSCVVLPFVVGLEPETQSFDGIMMYLLKILTYISQKSVSKSNDLFDILKRLSTEREIVILLDGLENLEYSWPFWEENFLKRLPDNVRIICTASNDYFGEQKNIIRLKAPSDILPYIKSIAIRHGKKFNNETLAFLVKAVFEANGNLNYAELLIRYLLTMHKEDYEKYTGVTAHLQWMHEIIKKTPRTIESCVSLHIERAKRNLSWKDGVLIEVIVSILKEQSFGITYANLYQTLISMETLKENQIVNVPPPPKSIFDFKVAKTCKNFERNFSNKLDKMYYLLRPLLLFDATTVNWSMNHNSFKI